MLASQSGAARAVAPGQARPTLRGHLQIARIDHWFKNVFVLPGIVVALFMDGANTSDGLLQRVLVGLLATCLVASSNYALNELIDAPFDRVHPTKHHRPAASGQVNIPLAYVEWFALMLLGVGLGLTISR